MAHFHLPHIPHPSHVHLGYPRLGEAARDSLWLFVALAIMIVVAAGVQWLFSAV